VIVVDASVLIEILLRMPGAERAEALVLEAGHSLHAPHLIDVEVAQVVRRMARLGEIEAERAAQAVADLAAMTLRRCPHAALLPRIWALRNNLTAYDASYVALAETLDAVLVTQDRRLAAAGGHHARVELV